MKILEVIWSDVRKGENIDLYATIVVAFGIVVLTLLEIAPPDLTGPLTLAVLGLLAISSIVNRHRIQALSGSQTSELPFLEEFPPYLAQDIEGAAELFLIGVTLTQTLRTRSWKIEKLLQRGCAVNVLLVDPNGPYIDIVEYRYQELHPGSLTHNLLKDVHQTLSVCCGLKSISPDKFNVRVIPYPLGHCAIAVNPNTSSGTIYIAHYSFGTSYLHIPKYILKPKDGKWYEYHKEEIQALWKAGTEWDCSKEMPS